MTAPAFEGWCVLELLGHRVRYGCVSEVLLFGEPFCRIDFPTDPPTFELYSGKAIYGVRPATEATIRAYHTPRAALTSRSVVDDEDDDEEIVSNLDGDGEIDPSPDALVVEASAPEAPETIVMQCAICKGELDEQHILSPEACPYAMPCSECGARLPAPHKPDCSWEVAF